MTHTVHSILRNQDHRVVQELLLMFDLGYENPVDDDIDTLVHYLDVQDVDIEDLLELITEVTIMLDSHEHNGG